MVKELIRLVRKLDIASHCGPADVERETWEKIRVLIAKAPVEAEKVEEKTPFCPSRSEVK